jgi:hypothetical protein
LLNISSSPLICICDKLERLKPDLFKPEADPSINATTDETIAEIHNFISIIFSRTLFEPKDLLLG